MPESGLFCGKIFLRGYFWPEQKDTWFRAPGKESLGPSRYHFPANWCLRVSRLLAGSCLRNLTCMQEARVPGPGCRGPGASSSFFMGSFSVGSQWPIEKTFRPLSVPQRGPLFLIQAKQFCYYLFQYF